MDNICFYSKNVSRRSPAQRQVQAGAPKTKFLSVQYTNTAKNNHESKHSTDQKTIETDRNGGAGNPRPRLGPGQSARRRDQGHLGFDSHDLTRGGRRRAGRHGARPARDLCH